MTEHVGVARDAYKIRPLDGSTEDQWCNPVEVVLCRQVDALTLGNSQGIGRIELQPVEATARGSLEEGHGVEHEVVDLAEKLFCFSYPSELLALLRGSNAQGETVIPLGRRVLYAVGTYTGRRKGSLFTLCWKHADFDHGTLASFKTKTGRAQYFVTDPGLMDVLQAWHEHQGKPGDDAAIVNEADVACDRKRLATALRDDLKAVGVTRALLFEEDAENVQGLRFHDLRSTFCTWARRAGKSDAWIGERTGHELSGDMISRYDRGAQTLANLDYEPFPAIGNAVPELAEFWPGCTRRCTRSRRRPLDRRRKPKHLQALA
jgi:hypothetical protein